MAKLAVVGSLNMDIVNRVEQHPKPGETIHGRGIAYYAGGKGANQAVAAAKAGAETVMAGAVGTDSFGPQLVSQLEGHGVDTAHVRTKEGSSGLALITVDARGENSIILQGGANAALTAEDIGSEVFDGVGIVLLQNEIPWEVNLEAMQHARRAGAQIVYNPAPASNIPVEALHLIDLLVVNETEAETIAGTPVGTDVSNAARRLLQMGIREMIITMGSEGAYYFSETEQHHMPAYPVSIADTTAAGDTFIGCYAAGRLRGMDVRGALRFASAAAALAVSKLGAQASIPTASEVSAFLEETPDRL